MSEPERFLHEHVELSRRFFLRSGAAGLVSAPIARGFAADALPAELAPALAKLESFFTPPDKFGDVSRGNPIPHSLSEEKRKAVGLTRDTWRLEVIPDPEKPANLGKPLTKKDDTAIDFPMLLKLGEKHEVRFPKVMTCLNIGCPLGMGLWEGIPLRVLVWLAKPRENLRRIFYYGYHNDDPKQRFQSSLPVGRVLEDYDDLPPILVCYKLNGDWLSPQRGGPVRMVVPEGYGFKSVKWLTHVVLSNTPAGNDTYANGNNDIDSPLKTFAATLSVPKGKANKPTPITGYAQAGISGLAKVQVWVSPVGKGWPPEDPFFTTAPWTDAHILPPPAKWGGRLAEDAIPADTFGFEGGKPKAWPLRLGKAHWAALLPGMAAGEYWLRCRTVDAKGQAQPMPRPFKKSGRCEIEEVKLVVEG